MHFGRVEKIENVDLTLPEDPLRTKRFLALNKTDASHFYIGCPIWACKEWVGNLYPKGTKPNQFLEIYAQHFNSVEVNSTFYHLIGAERIQQWQKSVDSAFRFCPKVYRGITEQLGRSDLQSLIAQFSESIAAFGSALGLCFAQLPETFAPRHVDLLVRFVKTWPGELPLAIELRHPAWFHDHSLSNEIIDFFYRHNVATVITDTPGRRDALHLSLTQPRVMIRFLGHELHSSDSERLAAWVPRLREWERGHMDDIYFFTHQPGEKSIPETARILQEMMGVKRNVGSKLNSYPTLDLQW